MKMRDRFWLWGQNAGSHHAAAGNKVWKLPGVNRMEPAEGADYMGIRNVCRVAMGGKPEPPFDIESEKLKHMKKVVWSAVGDSGTVRNNDDHSDLDEVLRQAKKFPNVVGAILDDFFFLHSINGKIARLSLGYVQMMRNTLHNFPDRPLELWVVYYKRTPDIPEVDEYLKLFDVITYWNMNSSAEIAELDDDIDRVIQRTKGKRRMAGCYLWNYAQGKPLTIPEVQALCEKYYEWILKGYTEGIIFCSNTLADLGLEAVEWARNWIKEVGDQDIT